MEDLDINFKDINGKVVTVHILDIYKSLKEQQGNLLFGMSFDVIREFRKQYLLTNGIYPLTIDSVKKFFENHKEKNA